MFGPTFTLPKTSLTTLGLLGLICLPLSMTACAGDDGESTVSATDPTNPSTDPSTTEPTTESTTGTETTAGPSTSIEPTTTSTDPTTSTTTTTTDGTETETTGPIDENLYGVLVLGTLFTADTQEAKDFHDPLAAGGEDAAKALGDFGHDALLGTTLLGTEENKFLGFDRWDNLDGLQMFYSDPNFAEQFGMLFDPNGPEVTTYVEREDWHTWGDMTSGDGGDYWFVVARGTLAGTPEEMQPIHDMVAAAGEEQVMMAGDVAHVVFLGLEDPTQFLAFDIWNNDQAIEPVYTDPDFQMAFGQIFEPNSTTIEVFRSTDWHQW